MKRIICVLILVFLVTGIFSGCGNRAADTAMEAPDVAADESTLTGNNTGEDESEAADQSGAANDPAVRLTVVNGMGTSDTASIVLAYFCDYIEEHSGGSVTFDRYFGGTFCSLPEEFSYVESGSVDVISLLPDMAISQLPYWNLCVTYAGTVEETFDYANYILFENPETAALCEEQAAASNVKILGFEDGGVTAYCGTKEFSSLEELSALKFGASRSAQIFENLGFNVVSAQIPDTYDSLSRGVFDVTAVGLSAMRSYKWYEVAPYCCINNIRGIANYLTVNLETWNSLSDNQQKVFEEAAVAAGEYSIKLMAEGEAAAIAAFEGVGGTVSYFSESDMETAAAVEFAAMVNTCREAAEVADCTEGMEIIISSCEEYAAEH